MSVVFKTTVNSQTKNVVDGDDTFQKNAPVYRDEIAAALPLDQQLLLAALGDAMGILAARERKEREQQVSELREKIATLDGKIDVLMSLIQGKGQVIDLPPLPKTYETSSERMIRKVRVSR